MSIHLLSEKVKHVGDGIAVGLGSTAVVSHWIDQIVNPAITMLIGLATLVWFYYRIVEIRLRIKNKKEED